MTYFNLKRKFSPLFVIFIFAFMYLGCSPKLVPSSNFTTHADEFSNVINSIARPPPVLFAPQSYSINIPTTKTNYYKVIQLPKYTGGGQLIKVVLKANLIPDSNLSVFPLPNISRGSSCTANSEFNMGISGQNIFSFISDSAILKSETQTQTNGEQPNFSNFSFTPYQYLLELNYPEDLNKIAHFIDDQSSQISIDVSALVNANIYCTGGNGKVSLSSQVSGNVSIEYTPTNPD